MHRPLRLYLTWPPNLERGNAIAVSVRSFKVGGIGGLLESSPQDLVSISTAMQVALELQLRGMEAR